MKRLIPLIALMLVLVAGPSYARPNGLAEARAAFAEGAFAHAATSARQTGSSDGFTLAAHAEMIRGDFLEPPGDARMGRYKAALADARKAVQKAPDDPEAQLALALALGLVARSEGGLEAHYQGLGEEARKHIDIALKLVPDSPWANATLGGWNLQIAYAGGALGEAIYGASVKKGISAYEKALRLDPGNVAIAYQYALQLLGLGGDDHRQRARDLLDEVAAHHPSNALQRLLRESAKNLKHALDRGDTEQAMKLAEVSLGSTR